MKAGRFPLAALVCGLICASSGGVLAQTLSGGPIKIIIPAAPATGQFLSRAGNEETD